MPEELSPESKLFVKEEIEKIRKDIREEVEDVKSKTTKTFTTVVIVVGLITGLGVYGSAKHYINTAVEAKIGTETMDEIKERKNQAQKFVNDIKGLVEDAKSHVKRAENSYNEIADYEKNAEKILYGRTIIGMIVPYGGDIPGKKPIRKKVFRGLRYVEIEISDNTPGDPCQVKPGWFFCNGASLDREEYKDLFDIIGVAFGAPDPNSFNLPDLRGRFIRGVSYGTGRDPDAALRKFSYKGGNTGNKVGSYQLDNIQTHSHQWGRHDSADLWSWNKKSAPVLALDRKSHNQIPGGSGKDDDYMDVAVGSFWTDLVPLVVNPETETRPKNVYVNWIIKAE